MTAGVRYQISVDYTTTGDLSKPNATLGSMSRHAGSISDLLSSAGGAASRLGDGLIDAVGSAASLAMHFGVLAGAAGIGAVVYGLTKVNGELEDTKIGMAALFAGNGVTNSFNDGISLAGDTMKQMRKDAAALPGEFKDLTNIFQTMATAGIGAGMDTKQLEKFSAQTMVLAAVTKTGFGVAGREMAAMLEGRATSRMPMFNKLGLGMDAKDFNKLDQGKRRSLLEKRASAVASPEAISAYQNSWVGLTTTLKDDAKLFVGNATAPLFEKIKNSMGGLSSWFSSHTALLTVWSDLIGAKLVKAFEAGERAIMRWGPAIKDFAGHAYNYFSNIWEAISPIVDSLSNSLRSSMIDGSLITRIEGMLKMGLALKVGGAVTSMIGAAAGGGGGGARGLIGAASMLGPEGTAIAIAALGAAAVATAGEISALADSTSKYHADAVKYGESLKVNMAALSGDVTSAGSSISQWFGVGMTGMMADYAIAIRDLIHPTESLRLVFNQLSGFFGNKTNDTGDLMFLDPRLKPTDAPEYKRDEPEPIPFGFRGAGLPHVENKPPISAPNHHTVIHKVEIVVNSNQDPSRIARLTVEKLAELSRNPTSSPGSKNPGSRR